MVVFVANKEGFGGAPHAVVGVVIFEAGESGEDAGVFFRLGFFGAEGVV